MVRLVALAFALALSLACATKETFEPRRPGDRCFEVCPEGLYCKHTAGTGGAGGTTTGGTCELDDNRCLAAADCHDEDARCSGASPVDVGYCSSSFPGGLK